MAGAAADLDFLTYASCMIQLFEVEQEAPYGPYHVRAPRKLPHSPPLSGAVRAG